MFRYVLSPMLSRSFRTRRYTVACSCHVLTSAYTLTHRKELPSGQVLTCIQNDLSTRYKSTLSDFPNLEESRVISDVTLANKESRNAKPLISKNLFSAEKSSRRSDVQIKKTSDDVSISSEMFETPPKKADFGKILKGLSDKEMLRLSELKRRLEIDEVVMILQRFVKVSSDISKVFIEDPSFDHLCNCLHYNVNKISDAQLLSSLRCLLQLSPEKDLFIVQSLETELSWRRRKLGLKVLMDGVEIHLDHQETELRKVALHDLVELIKLRWVEISRPKDLLALMYMVTSGRSEIEDSKEREGFLDKLEERALTLCEAMTAKDLYRILYLLAKNNRRNTPLLKAIVYHLNKRAVTGLSRVHLSNLLYACAQLNLFDSVLMSKITDQILTTPPSTSAIVSAMIRSIGMLRWRHVDLLDSLTQSLLSFPSEDLTISSSVGLLMTCAHLQYCPKALTVDKLELVVGKLRDLRTTDAKVWLDVVWCLALLQRLDSPTASTVLEKEFVSKLMDPNSSSDPLLRQKLLHVNAYAKLELAGYSGSLLDENFISANKIQVSFDTSGSLLTAVVSALSQTVNSERYLRLNKITTEGYNIDIEMFVRENGDFLPISDFDKKASVQSNIYRVALKVLEFNDMTLSSVVPTGVNSLEIRHLERLGYVVVQLSYDKVNANTKAAALAPIIQAEINSCIKKRQKR